MDRSDPAAHASQHTVTANGLIPNPSQPAIGYFSLSTLNVHYARFNGASWAVTTVDGSGSNGGYTSLAFGPYGQPSLAYFSSASADLRFARYNNSGWTITIVESAGDVGQYSSLKIAPDNQPAIAYTDFTNFFVRLARKGAFATP